MPAAKYARCPIIWTMLYLLTMALVFGSGHLFRNWALGTFATPQAQGQWETWRDEATTQARGIGPVTRREPKSEEPPALVLMRDHYVACQSISLVLSTALFVTLMIMIQGLFQPRATSRAPEDQAGRGEHHVVSP